MWLRGKTLLQGFDATSHKSSAPWSLKPETLEVWATGLCSPEHVHLVQSIGGGVCLAYQMRFPHRERLDSTRTIYGRGPQRLQLDGQRGLELRKIIRPSHMSQVFTLFKGEIVRSYSSKRYSKHLPSHLVDSFVSAITFHNGSSHLERPATAFWLSWQSLQAAICHPCCFRSSREKRQRCPWHCGRVVDRLRYVMPHKLQNHLVLTVV